MISTVQTKRPNIPTKSSSPMNQQPIRQFTIFSPRSQIEALPPNHPACTMEKNMVNDAAIRHPVFFTNRLIRAPSGVVTGEGITTGYSFEEGTGARNGARL